MCGTSGRVVPIVVVLLSPELNYTLLSEIWNKLFFNYFFKHTNSRHDHYDQCSEIIFFFRKSYYHTNILNIKNIFNSHNSLSKKF